MTYGIDDQHGDRLTVGLGEDRVWEVAQEMADERGEPVYVYVYEWSGAEGSAEGSTEGSTEVCPRLSPGPRAREVA